MASDQPASVLSATHSLCPVCLQRVPAVREQEGEDVFLVKECADHGRFRTVIWRGAPAFATGSGRKAVLAATGRHPVERGCPLTAACVRPTASTPAPP